MLILRNLNCLKSNKLNFSSIANSNNPFVQPNTRNEQQQQMSATALEQKSSSSDISNRTRHGRRMRTSEMSLRRRAPVPQGMKAVMPMLVDIGQLKSKMREKRVSDEEERSVRKNFMLQSIEDRKLEYHEEPLPLFGDVAMPSFNFGSFVNKSPTLQELVKLGVSLYDVEKVRDHMEFLLTLDFERDIKPVLRFLADQGVEASHFGRLITKNPMILSVERETLEQHVAYLRLKKFSYAQRQRILTVAPRWLTTPIRQLDKQLGVLQKLFYLAADELRLVAAKRPELVFWPHMNLWEAVFTFREEMGFQREDLRYFVMAVPKLFLQRKDNTIELFSFAHHKMGLTHEMLILHPRVLTARMFKLRERHGFLKRLNRAQYDHTKDLYVSPTELPFVTDEHFVEKFARSDMATYELYLRTL